MKEYAIPKSFELAGQQYTVAIEPNLHTGNLAGQIIYKEGRILISDDIKNHDYRAVTFFHELMHAIFFALGKDDLRADEELIDAMASLMWQFVKTSKYETVV